jgi:hypothetical protein
MRWIGPVAAGLSVAACAVTPLTNKISVGQEPFVIVVGEAPDGNTDLFAASASGGSFFRFTYNRPVEDLPRLAPDGKRVAFIRRQTKEAVNSTELVVFDLTTAGETRLPLPEVAWNVERLGWSPDGTRLFVSAGRSFVTPAPPARMGLAPVSPDSAAAADTLTAEALGRPPYALVRRCPTGEACILAGTETTSLGGGVTEAIRWGPDSLAYVRNGQLTVRPLRGGHQRVPAWVDAPRNLRSPTFYPGSGERSAR